MRVCWVWAKEFDDDHNVSLNLQEVDLKEDGKNPLTYSMRQLRVLWICGSAGEVFVS